jgi:hypothetical protein
VAAASITPTIVSSNPDAHHERIVMSDFNAPTEMRNDADDKRRDDGRNAAYKKNNGMIGMKAPMAVKSAAENAVCPQFTEMLRKVPGSVAFTNVAAAHELRDTFDLDQIFGDRHHHFSRGLHSCRMCGDAPARSARGSG